MDIYWAGDGCPASCQRKKEDGQRFVFMESLAEAPNGDRPIGSWHGTVHDVCMSVVCADSGGTLHSCTRARPVEGRQTHTGSAGASLASGRVLALWPAPATHSAAGMFFILFFGRCSCQAPGSRVRLKLTVVRGERKRPHMIPISDGRLLGSASTESLSQLFRRAVPQILYKYSETWFR